MKRFQKYKGLACCAATFMVPLTAHAAEFTVDTLSDIDADGNTLREAIVAANSTPEDDTISFATELSGTLVLSQGELDINTNITINGPEERISISGNDATRIFDVSISTVSFSNLNLTNGSNQGALGGAIRVREAELTLTNCEVSNNFCAGDGGGIGSSAAARLILINSELSNNVAEGLGGGISSCDSELSLTNCEITNNTSEETGGGISSKTLNDVIVSLTLTNCVVTGNSASNNSRGIRGGGVYAGDLSMVAISDTVFSGNSANSTIANHGVGGGFSGNEISNLNILNCVFSENESSAFGGGVSLEDCANAILSNSTIFENESPIGGGLASYSGDSVALTNCTIFGNNADAAGGGIYHRATDDSVINSCTITGNSTGDDDGGGGIYSAITSLEISNSICAFNSATGNNNDLSLSQVTSFTVAAPNLFSDSSSLGDDNPLLDGVQIIESDPANVFAATSEINEITTGTMGDNGGTIPTVLLLTGGSANNAGLNSALNADELDLDNDGDTAESLPIDARGFARISGAVIDLGAIELDQSGTFGLTLVEVDEEGSAILSFALSQELGIGESWILSRSTDLLDFEPIFSFDGTLVELEEDGNTSNFAPGTNNFTITDTNPPQAKAFYQLEIAAGIIGVNLE